MTVKTTRPTCRKCGEVLLLPAGPFGPNYATDHDDGCPLTCEWCGHAESDHDLTDDDIPAYCMVTDCECRC